jgi:hypothetical protein
MAISISCVPYNAHFNIALLSITPGAKAREAVKRIAEKKLKEASNELKW